MNTFKFWRKASSLVLFGGLLATAGAQTLEETMQKLSEGAAKQYVAPIVSGIGSNLNAGWYHKAPPAKKFRFSIEGGAVVSGTFLGTGATTIDLKSNFRFDSSQADTLIAHSGVTFNMNNPPEKAAHDSLVNAIISKDIPVQIKGPTVIGSGDSSVKAVFSGQKFTYNAGVGGSRTDSIPADTVDLKVKGLLGDFTSFPLPLVAPQVTLGTIYGTNFTFRWLPTMPLGDVGDFSFFGFGIQHNPAVWLGTSLPVDLCVGYFHQDLTFGSLFDASTNAIGLDVSKQLGWRLLNITPYGGFQWESSTMSFHYDQKIHDEATGSTTILPIKFDLEGENSTRLTVGVSIHVLILNLNADYNLAKYNSASVGIMFGI